MEKGAIFSDCGKYRYILWRKWNKRKPSVMIIGLNPSKADDKIDDPTVRRCISFAKTWGYGSLYVTNLFAFKATNPVDMLNEKKPVGAENDKYIKEYQDKVDKVVLAWGNYGSFKNRNKEILKIIELPHCLRINKKGEPSHVLYLNKTLKPRKCTKLKELRK